MLEVSVSAILLGALLVVGASYVFGRLFIHFLQLPFTQLERTIFSIFVGAAALSTLTFALCFIHQAQKGVFVTISILALLVLSRLPGTKPSQSPRLRFSRDQLAIGALIYLYFAGIYIINATAPEFSPDGATYHLGNVARWWKLHGFDGYTGSIYSNWSQGFELLFLVGFSVGMHSSAALIHCTFGLLLPFLFAAYGARIGKTWILTTAGLMLFVSPVVGRTASSAYNDLAVACLLFAIFYLMELWRADKSKGYLIACGWLAGFAFAVKYTSIVGIIYATFIVLWECRRELRMDTVRRQATLWSWAALPALPWVIHNAIVFKNPFSPFFNRFFDNPFVHASFEADYSKAMSLYPEISSRLELPWLWAVDGNYVGGIFGPWLLLAPLALLGLKCQEVRKLLLAACLLGWPVLFNCGTRFLLPAMLFIAPALMISFSRIGLRPIVLLTLHSVLSIPQLLPFYCGPHAWKFDELPWRAALRMESVRTFLTRKMDAFPIAESMETLIPLHSKSFASFQVPLAYTTRRVWHNWQSAEAQRAHTALLYPFSAAGRAGLNYQFSFAGRWVYGLRIRALANSPGPWEVAEFVISQNGTVLPRHAGWKIRSSRNKWEKEYALDNNPATSWSTSEALRAGDEFEIQFEEMRSMDRLTVVAGGMSNETQWRLEAMVKPGIWDNVPFQFQLSARSQNPDPKRSSIEALRNMKFEYLILNRAEEFSRDLMDKPGEWGLEPMVRIGDYAILRIPEH